VVTVPGESPAAGTSPTAGAGMPPSKESNPVGAAASSSATGSVGLPIFESGASSGRSSPIALSGFVAVLAVGWLLL